MAKRALITGITGQDGSYLSELLLGKGYEVFGLVRRASTEPLVRKWRGLERAVEVVEGEDLDVDDGRGGRTSSAARQGQHQHERRRAKEAKHGHVAIITDSASW